MTRLNPVLKYYHIGIYISLTLPFPSNGIFTSDWGTKKPASFGGLEVERAFSMTRGRGRRSLLPSALLVAIRLQALATLVFVHLETALLLEVAHGVKTKVVTI